MRSQATVVKYVESGGTDFKPRSKNVVAAASARVSSAASVRSTFVGGSRETQPGAGSERVVVYQLRVTQTGLALVQVALVEGGGERGVGTDGPSDVESSHDAAVDTELEDEAAVAAAPLGGAAASAPTIAITRKPKRKRSRARDSQSDDGDGGGGGDGAPRASSGEVFVSPIRSKYVGVWKHGNGYG